MEEYVNSIILGDCLEFMRKLPDKCVDLVLTDPPYGIGVGKSLAAWKGVRANQHGYTAKAWDESIPGKEYFAEMLRVSKHQIIWGGNYFTDRLPNSSCWLVWNKLNGENDFADCELAFTSFKKAVRLFEFRWQGMLQGDMKHKEARVHPTQKPVPLFLWCLEQYSKPGDIVLDPFSGSGTTAIAAHRLGRRFICVEKDEEYHAASVERLRKEREQLLFQF